MDRRQKCKKCRRGILEPTFNGEEMKCFICGWTTMFTRIYTFTVYNDDITKTHGIYNKELDHDVDLQTKGVDLSWERDGTKKNARIIKILKVSSDTYDTSDKGQSSTKQKQVPDGL